MVLYFMSANGLQKARTLAKKHLGGDGHSELQAEFSLGLTSALVLNDWGVVYARQWNAACGAAHVLILSYKSLL